MLLHWKFNLVIPLPSQVTCNKTTAKFPHLKKKKGEIIILQTVGQLHSKIKIVIPLPAPLKRTEQTAMKNKYTEMTANLKVTSFALPAKWTRSCLCIIIIIIIYPLTMRVVEASQMI